MDFSNVVYILTFKNTAMSLLETYCIIGFLFTMFFEYLFETNQDSEMKFTGLTERILFFVLWPLILLIVVRKTLKKNNIF